MTLTAVCETDQHVLLQADDKGNIVFVEEIHPIRPYELTVCQEGADGRCPEQAQIALHEFNALSGGRITCMVQKNPHERHSETTCDDGQNQDVHIARSEFPIRPVKRQQPGAVQVQHLYDQVRGKLTVQSHELEEALQTAIIRSMFGVSWKLACQMRQVNRPAVCQANEQNCQSFKPRLA